MNRFTYARPTSVATAVGEIASHPGARFIAGGTNLVDLMKADVEHPARLVDVSRISGLGGIEPTGQGGLRIGALVSNADVAWNASIGRDYPLLASAILAGASPQLRNAATTGGNLLQRTRCYYFYDPATPCNKRQPGSGCSAIGGVNRIHAILGANESCIATHPSDMCVALAALEAVVHVAGPRGERSIAMADFHRLPGDAPERDTSLAPDELVLAVELPPPVDPAHSSYLKLRDRLSYAFALVSVAVSVSLQDGRIARARIAVGGVAARPWRVPAAEHALEGQAPDPARFAAAADALLHGAVGRGQNDFKIPLARKAIVRALSQAVAGTPQSQTDKRVA